MFVFALSSVFCVFLGIECFGGATFRFFVVCSVCVSVIRYHLSSLAWRSLFIHACASALQGFAA